MRYSRAVLLLAIVGLGASAAGQILVRTPNVVQSSIVASSSETDVKTLWIGGPSGLSVVRPDGEPRLVLSQPVIRVFASAAAAWTSTTAGLYRIDATTLIPQLVAQSWLPDNVITDGDLSYVIGSGHVRILRGVSEIANADVPGEKIIEASPFVWNRVRGLLLVKPDQILFVAPGQLINVAPSLQPPFTSGVCASNTVVFIGSAAGLHVIDSTAQQPVISNDWISQQSPYRRAAAKIHTIEAGLYAGSTRIWIATDDGIFAITYPLERASTTASPAELQHDEWLRDRARHGEGRWLDRIPTNATKIYALSTHTYAATEHVVYQISENQSGNSLIVGLYSGSATLAFENTDRILFVANARDGDDPFLDPTYDPPVVIVTTHAVYIQTPDAAGHLSPSGWSLIHRDVNHRTEEFATTASLRGKLWVAGSTGAYVIRPQVKLTFDINGGNRWRHLLPGWLGRLLLGGTVTPTVLYDGDLNTKPAVSAIIAPAGKDYNDRYVRQAYVQLDGTWLRNLGSGLVPLTIDVRDEWGNQLHDQRVFIVVPGLLLTWFTVPAAWCALLIFTVIFAPTNRFARRLFMNPVIRKYGFFGLVPVIIVVVKPVKHRLLQPYKLGVASDRLLSAAVEAYVLPSETLAPAQAGAMIAEHRRLFVRGPSGIGKTAYLKYLLHEYSAAKMSKPSEVTPVYVPLVRFREESPLGMIQTQLAAFGEITDVELTTTMLDDGAFLVLFDGLNEIEPPKRDVLSAFIERYGSRNYFVMASQEEYPEFGGWRLDLQGLDRDHIEAFLRSRLPIQRANHEIELLNDERLAVYRVPQDLELAVALLKIAPSLSLPASRIELYEALVRPLKQQWDQDGRADLWTLTTFEALAMVVERRFSLNLDNELMRTAKTALLDFGLIKDRAHMYFFRHEQIRAFFAAEAFQHQWREWIPSEGATKEREIRIDPTWLPMLEFALLLLDDAEAFEMWQAVSTISAFIALQLYRGVRLRNPGRVEPWKAAVESVIGAAIVRDLDSDSSSAAVFTHGS